MKLKLGQMNTLHAERRTDFGVYLSGGPEEILLPNRYVPKDLQLGEDIEVFIYLDNEERLTATTETPKAMVGDFAWLQVAWVNNFGAFLDWGLMKDLFVPFREQKMKMIKGNSYLVHLHIDEDTYRIMASAKVERYLSQEMPTYKPGQEVEILIWQKTDLGFKAIVDNQFAGLLYDNQIFTEIHSGDRMKAYIQGVREDGKIDLSLQPHHRKTVKSFSDILLQHLQANGGHTDLCDKSPSEEIYAMFGVSKRTFKEAVGDLYKRHKIILDRGITLIKDS